MDLNFVKKSTCFEKFLSYCCSDKRDLLKNNDFERTIEIFPRVLVCRKLTKCETYHHVLTIRNTGTISRELKFFTEPNSDVSYKIAGDTVLTSEAYVTVDIYIEPGKLKINQNRFFYILAQHPDIVMEVPLIAYKDEPEVYIPELICLYKVPANTYSNYQFIIYNPLEYKIQYTIYTNSEGFSVNPSEGSILPKDYKKILISAQIPDQDTTTNLIVTLNNEKPRRICVHMSPCDKLIHLSTSVVAFEDTYIGLKAQKYLRICNNSMESVTFKWTCKEIESEKEDVNGSTQEDIELVISEFLNLKNQRGLICPMSSALSIITFSPPSDFTYDQEGDPPFMVNTSIYLSFPILGIQSNKLQVTGNILGPEINITPISIDLGTIFIGQNQCLNFKVYNKGPIEGIIFFKEHTDQDETQCTLNPSSIKLQPNSNDSFKMSFYRRTVGKFLTRFTFKIKDGCSRSILIRGTSLAIEVKLWPDSFDLGNIPICIPQKCFALVSNPLSVPIVIEPKVINDGLETPLMLCVDYSKLPLHTKLTTHITTDRYKYDGFSEEELRQSLCLQIKASDVSVADSQISWMFQNKVLDDISAMAEDLLKSAKHFNHHHKLEPGLKIIDAALDCIFQGSDYFQELKDNQNYLSMDWDALPSDAKEIAIETTRFYLKPNEFKSFPIELIPNSPGVTNKEIQFKICPMGIEDYPFKNTIESKYLTNSLRLSYKCIVPKLECTHMVTFSSPVYVEQICSFELTFRNVDVVPAFVYFKAIPESTRGEIKINEAQRKFFIAPNDVVAVGCTAIFRVVGIVSLDGLFQLIGKQLGCAFFVKAKVLPPAIRIIREKACHRQQVLESWRTRIFIENICSGPAKFVLSLENENYQFLEPLGGNLAPNQKILISLHSRYLDPGIYKNCVYVHLKHSEKLSVPVQFFIMGTPLIFDPNIKCGFDCGQLFKNQEDRNYSVSITNFGEKEYRLSFIKKNPKSDSTGYAPSFNIEPKGLVLTPKSKAAINISLDTSKAGSVAEEYSVDCIAEKNNKFKYFTFTANCTVVHLKVQWSKSEIWFATNDANNLNDKLRSINERHFELSEAVVTTPMCVSDTVWIINCTPFNINASLKVCGQFGIYDEAEDSIKTSYHIDLKQNDRKELTIVVNVSETGSLDMCQFLEGSVKCKVNNKAQKPLPLYLKLHTPGLKICNPQVTFFTGNRESYGHINIQNCSSFKGSYTWKHISSNLTKITFSKNCLHLSSKTISEVILSSNNESNFKIPRRIKSICPEVGHFDENSSDHDNETTLEESQNVHSKNISTTSPITEGNLCKRLLTPGSEVKTKSPDINKILEPFKVEPLKLPFLEEPSKDNQFAGGDHCLQVITKEPDKSVEFQQKCWHVLPKTLFKAYMFLPPLTEDQTLVSRFELKVQGGFTEALEVAVTGLKGHVQVSKTNIDFGKQIWCKSITDKIQITNLSPNALKVNLVKNIDDSDSTNHLINGLVKISALNQILLTPKRSISFKLEILMGLQNNFLKDVGVEVNNSTTPISIHLHGAGLMPMIALKDPEKMIGRSDEPLEIKRLKETEKFLNELKKSKQLRETFFKFHRNSMSLRELESEPVINIKLTICRPVPWELPVFTVNMGKLVVNETMTYQLEFSFIGPGKMFLSARTATPIPGLTVWFEEDFQNSGNPHSFQFFLQPPCENILRKYKNMYERHAVEAHMEGKEKAIPLRHSYDYDEFRAHKRKIPLKNDYTKLCQPWKEEKKHLILAEICQSNEANIDNSTFKLALLFTPMSKYYDQNQVIKDYLFIDTHLGPTLPILLNGQVIS